jgi:DNA-directed RNA polymerase subunit K/omega
MIDIKKTKAPNNTITYDRKKVKEPTKNIYKAIKIVGKRAEQINLELKEELIRKLKDFETDQDSLAEIFENKEQIDISKYYERLSKPTMIALQEWLDKNIYWKDINNDEFNEFQ